MNDVISNTNNRLSSYHGSPIFLAMAVASCIALTQSAWAASFPTGYTNIGSISNTRHNLTIQTTTVAPVFHNHSRNQYGEVCVYCHTPHGANQTANGGNSVLPLWNRTIKVTNYQTYDELGTSTLTQTVSSTPGSASLTCLSCHDGQTAIDSIINMPGSGKGLLSQATTQNTAFLDTQWNNPTGVDTTMHRGLNSVNNTQGNGTGSDGTGCMACHSPVGFLAVNFSVEGPDFRLWNIGTDLRNDHPIGITYPTEPTILGTDFVTPNASVTRGPNTSRYFDDGDSKMEKDEIRTYEGKVECASCHDPHGVPNPLNGNIFKPTFLRKVNTGSAVCLTCHIK